MSEPRFAVVGHPNKGKSSIVATLAADDSVQVAPQPGTTVRCRSFPMRIDGEVLYSLVDTPGFQRARRALHWMRQHESSTARRAEVVRLFLEEHRGSEEFVEERELLAPVVDGAGILYVVDGSLPYGPEYEAEMEILRWTGQPSLALINPIGEADHVAEWTAALGQFFKVVRVFNALTAEFDKRLQLLRAFGQLREEWRGPLDRAVQVLEADRGRRRMRAAREIGEMIADMVMLVVSEDLLGEADPADHRAKLERRYMEKLRARERQGRVAVEAIYEHHKIERSEREVDLLDQDLFSSESFYLWGLSRSELLTAGAAGGAVIGGTIDAMVGGATFLLGSALGATVGATLALLSADRLARHRILTLPLGGQRLRFGPSTQLNFPFVILGRARYHHALVSGRTHAQRGPFVVESQPAGRGALNPLPDEERRALTGLFERLRRDEEEGAPTAEIARVIEPLLRDGPTR